MLSLALAALALPAPTQQSAQATHLPKQRPLEDPQRFDDATLLKSWGGPGDFVGPSSGSSRPPPPIRPRDYLVVEASSSSKSRWQAFVCKYLLESKGPEPTEGSVGPSGDSKWHQAKAPERGELKGEFRFAHTVVSVDKSGVWMARVSGATSLFVNGEGFMGDPERRGYLGVPVQLTSGANRVFVAGVEGGFELEFWKPQSRIVFGTWDLTHPLIDDDEGNRFRAGLGLPLFNASKDPVYNLHYHYGHAQCDDGHKVPDLSDWCDGGRTGPLGIVTKDSPLFGDRDGDAGPGCMKLLVPLCSYDQVDSDADRRVIQLALGDVHGRPQLATAWRPNRPESASYFVYGTRGSPEYQATSLAVARYYQQRLWYYYNACPELLSDQQLYHNGGDYFVPGEAAFAFGGPNVNLVAAHHGSSADSDKQGGDLLLRVTAPTPDASSPERIPVAVLSAPDPRTLRLLYAVDPYIDLKEGDKEAVFGVDPKTGAAVIRQK